MSKTYEVTQFVVEARRGRRPWLTMATALNEDDAVLAWDSWMATKRRTESRMRYRMVKRTAVITDEVLRRERDEDGHDPACSRSDRCAGQCVQDR